MTNQETPRKLPLGPGQIFVGFRPSPFRAGAIFRRISLPTLKEEVLENFKVQSKKPHEKLPLGLGQFFVGFRSSPFSAGANSRGASLSKPKL